MTAGCRQDMQDQPKMKPFRSTTFFSDKLSMRPPVAGTVPRGLLRADSEFFTGKKGKGTSASASAASPAPPTGTTTTATPSSAANANAFPDDITVLPIPVSKDILTHGKERFEIFCSVCHGITGYGDGMVVRRGFRRAASFHDDRLREAPVGHFFDAITNGWGAMPSYAAQIPAQDRWAIVAYIRALQLSQKNSGPPQPASAGPAPSSSGGHGP